MSVDHEVAPDVNFQDVSISVKRYNVFLSFYTTDPEFTAATTENRKATDARSSGVVDRT